MKYRKPDNDDQARWAKDIKNYRLHIGLSVESMAKHLGIPAFRLSKIEAGVQPATEELCLKASEVWEDFSERDYEESRDESELLREFNEERR